MSHFALSPNQLLLGSVGMKENSGASLLALQVVIFKVDTYVLWNGGRSSRNIDNLIFLR